MSCVASDRFRCPSLNVFFSDLLHQVIFLRPEMYILKDLSFKWCYLLNDFSAFIFHSNAYLLSSTFWHMLICQWQSWQFHCRQGIFNVTVSLCQCWRHYVSCITSLHLSPSTFAVVRGTWGQKMSSSKLFCWQPSTCVGRSSPSSGDGGMVVLKGLLYNFSRNRLNSTGESRHPCLMPTVVWNSFPSWLLRKTALLECS